MAMRGATTSPLLHQVLGLQSGPGRQCVLLSFMGDLGPELVTALLNMVERKMGLIEPDQRVRKRVFNVVMECLQNLHHHGRSEQAAGRSPEDGQGVVMITRLPQGYSVLTGNFMAPGEVDRLRAKLDRVNALTAEGLRALYKEQLANGRYSASGGGGLGLIDIARRSGTKLEYGFVPHDARRTFFSLNVNVPS